MPPAPAPLEAVADQDAALEVEEDHDPLGLRTKIPPAAAAAAPDGRHDMASTTATSQRLSHMYNWLRRMTA